MEIFFYGLFMDKDLLSKKGINPVNPRKGYLDNYALRIGQRASLISRKNERSYGIVMTLGDEEVTKLYSERSVVDYVPEEVEVMLESGESLMAICYNLPGELIKGTNIDYVRSLFDLAKKLNFPKEYVDKIVTQR